MIGCITSHHRAAMDRDGFAIVEDALSAAELDRARAALQCEIDAMAAAGRSTHLAFLDHNAANIRANYLASEQPVCIDLLRHAAADEAVRHMLGPHWIVSNFSANVALPGALPMRLHSDQALSVPAPWAAPWVCNIIWCLDDIDAENGATQYLPGSHRFRDFDDVPGDAEARLESFKAPAGSFIAMEGRLWHTSGANVSQDRQRRLLFAYYAMDFVRPQINWEATLSARFKASLDADARRRLCLGTLGNGRLGQALTQLNKAVTE